MPQVQGLTLKRMPWRLSVKLEYQTEIRRYMCGHWLHLIFFPCSWSAKLDQLTSITGPQVAGHLGYSLMSGFGNDVNAHAQFVGCAMFVACWGLHTHSSEHTVQAKSCSSTKLEKAEKRFCDDMYNNTCDEAVCDSCDDSTRRISPRRSKLLPRPRGAFKAAFGFCFRFSTS